VPDGSGIAPALDYSLNRWQALSRFLRDGEVSCHNNHLENRLRPWAMGRKAWLFESPRVLRRLFSLRG
jgi:transposase